MDLYQTPRAIFDIHETDSGKWAVIHVPNLNEVAIGTGKVLGSFDSQTAAKKFCNDWDPDATP